MDPEPAPPGDMPVGGLLSEYLACSEPPPDHLNDIGDMDEGQGIFDDPEPHQIDNEEDIENSNHQNLYQERDPDYPIELNDSQNQYLPSQTSFQGKMQGRPKKKKSKGKNKKMNSSMTNRSSSAKWRKVDPYLHGQPASIKMLKQMKRSGNPDVEGVPQLPPIKKGSSHNTSKQQNSRVYRPLQSSKLQKANSTTLTNQDSKKNIQIDEEPASKPKHRSKMSDIDYEKKNLERLQRMQEKKAKEIAEMEDQRRKAQEEREKLKKIVFKRAEEHRKIREERQKLEEEQRKLQEEQEKQEQQEKPKKKKKKFVPKPEDGNEEDESEYSGEELVDEQKKEEASKLKKYFKNRYISFLKTLKEENSKKKEEEEKARLKEERLKKKLEAKIGIGNVQSRVFEEPAAQTDEPHVPRSSSMAGSKKSKLIKSYGQQAQGTPKNTLRNRLSQVKEIDEQVNNEEKKKEIQQKREANERIRKKQEEYLKSLAQKKMQENQKEEEERKRQENLRQNLRMKVKGMLDNVERKPKADPEPEEENKEQRKMNPEDIQNFLERNSQKKKVFTNITDFDMWKKKNRVDKKTKVFVCTGGYAMIRKALTDRGWVENKDPKSPCFDLKWTLRARDLHHQHLQSHQVVNHFCKSAAITTKVGLCHSLKNLIWFNNVDVDTFYPQCFDLKDRDDFEEFVEQFKAIKAECLVKKYADEIEEVDKESLKVAMKVCERRLMDLDDIIDLKNPPKSLVSDEEWEIIAKDELNESKLAKKKHKDWLRKMDCWRVAQHPNKKKEEKKKAKKPKKTDKEAKETIDIDDEDELRERCQEICERLKKKFVQYDMNGINNIWIVKPAGLSRGRGIEVFASLVEILDNCHREGQWVAQKYMENPMIIHGRKFDIRQWVLVTSWNPLVIWFWNKPYIRFPAAEYDPNNLNDRFVHLTNNSVAKYAKNCTVLGEGNMWDVETFSNYLQETYGEDVWEEGGLRKKMQQVVKYTLEAVQDMFDENNKNATCTELYGFDLMLDDKCNPWLLEVNSSPTMEFSTPITEYLCKKVMEDTIKVIVDHHYAKKKSKIDTGDWELICKKKAVENNPKNACGLDFVCQGVKMKVKKQKNTQAKKSVPVKEFNFGGQVDQAVDEVVEAEEVDSVDEVHEGDESEDGEGEQEESEEEDDAKQPEPESETKETEACQNKDDGKIDSEDDSDYSQEDKD